MASSSPKRNSQSGSDSGTATISPESKTTTYVPRCTADQYVRAMAHHSEQSSVDTPHPGEIYRSLKRFFEQESNHVVDSNAFRDFAYLISPRPIGQEASPDGECPPNDHMMVDRSKTPKESQTFADPEACIKALKGNIEMSHPQVLFLRGHPSPSWLSTIGAFCHVDPELFRWFLRYRDEPGSDYYFGPSPPSMSNMFRFKFFTIGSRPCRYGLCQVEVDTLRSKAAESLRKYRTNLRGNWALQPGDSIVRNFHVLDEHHCLIEQEIVFHIFDVGKTWMAIACTDAGRDLSRSHSFSWLGAGIESSPVTLLPIVQYRQRCALNFHSIDGNANPPKKVGTAQSLSIFPEGYGHGLDWSLAESDRSHILSDVFRLAAFSQKQVLNIMKEKIFGETDRLSSGHATPTLANLLYFRDVLEDQLSNASYMMKLTDDRNNMPKSVRTSMTTISAEQESVLGHTAIAIHNLFQELHSQAQFLHEKCTQGMTDMSNNSMLTESQRTIQQDKFVTKLTVFAFAYLPFTVTTGFFGMNFEELGSGNLPIWLFFAFFILAMIIMMVCFLLDMQPTKRLPRGLRAFGQNGREIN